jgi:hypothetical protein
MERVKGLAVVSLLAAGLLAIPAKGGPVYYTYTGDSYTTSQSPLSSSSYVSFSMWFDNPLAGNLVDFDENANASQTWSVTDQTNSLSHDNHAYWDFYISTDSSGNITAWDITVTGQDSGTAFSTAYGGLNSVADEDQSSYNVGGTDYSGYVDGSTGNPQGSWNVESTPEPWTSVMTLIGGVVLSTTIWRKRAVAYSHRRMSLN